VSQRGRQHPGGPLPGPAGQPSKGQLPREAEEELRRTVRGANAEEAIRHLSRAIVLLARGDAKAAIPEAERAKGLAPRSPYAREVLGLAYYGRGLYKESLAEVQAYRRMSDRPDQNHIASDCLRALGQPEKAVALAEEELRGRVPEEARAEAAVVGASALADMGKFEQALAMLRRYPGKRGVGRDHDLRVWYVTGDVLLRAGRKAEAAEEFRRILRHDPSAFDTAERLRDMGEPVDLN
jgi:tetratricopeptide (TPR) repeat protein